MSDFYATITEVDPEIQERLADVLEMRAADPRQQEMLHSYLSEINFPSDARVLEIGCGTGAVTRALAQWPGVAQAVGIDPSALFISKAKVLSESIPNISFEEADGRSLAFDADSFDVVVVHTTMCHVPDPESLVTQAYSVLRNGGWLAVFDGDYATITVATGGFDPLETCIDAFRDSYVHDRWLVRRLPKMIQSAGFAIESIQSHGYLEAPEGGYMLTLVDRGVDLLLQSGRIGPDQAETLKAEARRRSEAKEWFGHIAFASVLGRKPE
jgi:SAM-dependent methyltransferase